MNFTGRIANPTYFFKEASGTRLIVEFVASTQLNEYDKYNQFCEK